MSLETREIKLSGRDIPGFCRDIPAVPEKFEKNTVCVQFPSPNIKKNKGNLQLELFCLQLSFFAYSPLRPLLDALSHCKQKPPIVSKKAKIVSKKAPIVSRKAKIVNCK